MRLLLIQGTGVVAAMLGLIGSYRSRPRVTLAGAVLLFVLSIPLMLSGAGILTLLLAVMLLISFQLNHSVQQKTA